MALGCGEYSTPGYLPPESFACERLISALVKIAPNALWDARERSYRGAGEREVRWLFRFERFFTAAGLETNDLTDISKVMRRTWRLSEAWCSWYSNRHDAQALRDTQRDKQDWMAKWGIGTVFVADAVFDITLYDAYRLNLPSLRAAAFAPPGDGARFIPSPTPTRLDFGVPDWDPAFELRVDYERRVRSVFDAYLKDELDAMEGDAWRRGDLVPPAPVDRHFEWFVYFQVLGETYQAIADEYACSYQSVATGVGKVAQLLNLPVRQATRGRPRRGKVSGLSMPWKT
jgi:hypothetical protein